MLKKEEKKKKIEEKIILYIYIYIELERNTRQCLDMCFKILKLHNEINSYVICICKYMYTYVYIR